MSLHQLHKIVGKAAKALYDNESFPVEVLAVRARQAAQVYSTDPTVVAMSNFLTKRAESEPLITRASFRDAYNRLYSHNNKFGTLFASELGLGELDKPKTYQRDPNEGKDLMKEVYEKMSDPVLANALSSVFDKGKTFKPYSASLAKMAERTCLHELNRFAAPRKIDIVAGQPDLLICKATYQTPKGETAVLIPVEVKENVALIPTVFLTPAGFVDISKEALKQHLQETAGKSYHVDAQKILQIVSNVKNGNPIKPVSDLDMILSKVAAERGTPATHTMDGILYQQIDPEQQEVKIEQTAESLEFGKRLATAVGAAEFKFGKNVVSAGNKLIRNHLNHFGFKNANVAVADIDENNIFFAVSIDNKKAFKVPVSVKKHNGQYLPEVPKFALASGGLHEFSTQGISKMMASDEVDSGMMAVASPLYGIKPSELVEQVRKAMEDGNLSRAEEALSVLQESNDASAYKAAFNYYLNGLNIKKEASAEAPATQCCMQRKVAHSKYLICGHTNLPVHKVYQDERGDCHPLYRKQISEPTTGSFLHSKVYFG